MAIYKIAALNYVTAGQNRAFVNMDTVLDYELFRPVVILRKEELDPGTTGSELSVLSSDILTEQKDGVWLKTEFLAKECSSGDGQLSDAVLSNALAASPSSTDVLLDETQRYYDEFEDADRRFVRLYPPGTGQATLSAIDSFNAARRHPGRTFVLDINLAARAEGEGDDAVDSGLNDMNLVGGKVYPMYDMVDVHVKSANKRGPCALRKFDADFASEDIYLPQLQQDPIGFCQVQSNAYMLTEATPLAPGMLVSSLLQQRQSSDVASTYTVSVRHPNNRTYLYSQNDVMSQPRQNIDGIAYNNVTEFPQSGIKAGYSQGNEYGYIVRGKNALDSRYNMVLSQSGSNLTAQCREYAGIGQFAGGQIYFKFYDGEPYSGPQSGQTASLTKQEKSTKSYQKIECAYFNKYTSANMHKTRFFSIRMLNTELGQYEDVDGSKLTGEDLARKKLYSDIMQDIRGAVREIAENLKPSHTQLYRVMFDG